MLEDPDQNALRRLLDLLDDAEALADALHTEARPVERRRLRQRHREALEDLYASLAPEMAHELPSMVRDTLQRFELDPEESLLLLFLLHRRIAAADPVMTGRDLLSLLSDSPFDLVVFARLLHANGRLVASGLVNAHLPNPEGALEGEFRLADKLYRQLYREFHGLESVLPKPEELPPYASPLEHLLDWKYVVVQAQRRAAVLFPQSYWAEVHPPADDRPEEIGEYISLVRDIIRSREERSTEIVQLPLEALRKEFKLEEPDVLILLALFYQELLTSTPVMEGYELLRLVCTTEEEIFLRRDLLGSGSRLVENGLVAVDRELDAKELLAGLYLPDWVTERLLPKDELRSAINQEERRRFLEYLRRLESSEDFYDNL